MDQMYAEHMYNDILADESRRYLAKLQNEQTDVYSSVRCMYTAYTNLAKLTVPPASKGLCQAVKHAN